MNQSDLYDALSGLHAYDGGALDSGIHDELLRQRVKDYLKGLPDRERAVVLGRYVRETFLTEERLMQRYSLADVQSFLNWLDQEMDITD